MTGINPFGHGERPVATGGPAPEFTAETSAMQNQPIKIGDTLYLVTFQYGSRSLPGKDLYTGSAFFGMDIGSDLYLKDVRMVAIRIDKHRLVNWEHDVAEMPPTYHSFSGVEESMGHVWSNHHPNVRFAPGEPPPVWDFRNITAQSGVYRSKEILALLHKLQEILDKPHYTQVWKIFAEERVKLLVEQFRLNFPHMHLRCSVEMHVDSMEDGSYDSHVWRLYTKEEYEELEAAAKNTAAPQNVEVGVRDNNLMLVFAKNINGVIGKDGGIPWYSPQDFMWFKTLTKKAPGIETAVIMGRVTWESLPKRPLPDRVNYVISRQPDYAADGAIVVRSLLEALLHSRIADPNRTMFVIGGKAVLEEAAQYASQACVSEIFDNTPADESCVMAPSLPDHELIDSKELFEGDERHPRVVMNHIRFL